jgi:pimeloyl-ACP methyl ester carboxylesterase
MQDRCKGVVLFNTSGGMTSFRYEELPVLLRPILWFVQNMLKRYGNGFWEKFKQPENVEQILKGQVYRDNTNVDEELLDVILNPSYDEGAREVFLAVFGGEAGPTPADINGEYKNGKILALWGTGDTWTPLDGGLHPGSRLGEYVKEGVEFELVRLEGAGHCPHDETPDLCHKFLGPWLVNLE